MKYAPTFLIHKNVEQKMTTAVNKFGKWLKKHTPYNELDPTYKSVNPDIEFKFLTKWWVSSGVQKDLFSVLDIERKILPHFTGNDVWFFHGKGKSDKYIANYTWSMPGFVGYEIVTSKEWDTYNLYRVLTHEWLHGEIKKAAKVGFDIPQGVLDDYYKEYEVDAPDGNRARAIEALKPYWEFVIMTDMDKQTFIDKATAEATKARKKYAFNVPVAVAQCALESGYGKSSLAAKYNNIKGVKAHSRWKGKTIELPTKEYINGKWVDATAKWCWYNSWAEAFEDYGLMLKSLPWYKDAVANADNAGAFLNALVNPGEPAYATDPTYKEKVWKIIKQYNLEQPVVALPNRALLISLLVKVIKLGRIDLAKILIKLL